jgi:hypothetical protein
MRAALFFLGLCACGTSGGAADGGGVDASVPDSSLTDAPSNDGASDAAIDAADAAPQCFTVTDAAAVTIATASASGEHVLQFDGASASATSWGAAGNEALILEIAKNGAFVTHVILHQGATSFGYGTHVGALAQGDVITARVSTLSAQNAVRSATVCSTALTPSSTLGALQPAIDNAPIWVWPIQKSFDDVPLVVSWSPGGYSTFFTNENGGTTELCGGGAKGLEAEIRLWGRACDIESDYSYAQSTFERCTGSSSSTMLRFEHAHPFLYHGDGHNRAFEDRSGYGNTCGSSSDNAPDGTLTGWGSSNPDPKDDLKYSIILRPIPFATSAVAYAFGGSPRERVLTKDAPWMFRLAGLETAREGKIDNSQTLTWDRYLHADVYVADVDGTSSSCPITGINGGFRLRAHATNTNVTSSSGEVTSASVSGQQWKHVSVPLDAVHVPSDFDQLIFDAYDNDGIYLLGIGDVYVLTANGKNGATVAAVRTGAKTMGEYVDDDLSGCVNGMSTYMSQQYPCVANLYAFAP